MTGMQVGDLIGINRQDGQRKKLSLHSQYPDHGPLLESGGNGYDILEGQGSPVQDRAGGIGCDPSPVSYTHLTLPTNREV